MEVSLLLAALGAFAYNLLVPVLGIRTEGGKAAHYYPINQYFGDEIRLKTDVSRANISADIFGNLSIQPRKVTTFCGDYHWGQVNKRRAIH